MEIFFTTIRIIGLLFFSGLGFTYLLIPKNLSEDAFWLTPWFGTSLIAIFGVFLSLLKIPMIVGKMILSVIFSLLFLVALFKKRVAVKITLDFIFILVLTAICLIINLYPLVSKVGFPTTISLGNLDPVSYTTVSDFLVKHTVYEGKEITPFRPTSWSTGDLLHYGYRWATPLILSFFASTLNRMSYEVFSILLSIFFALSYPLMIILAKIAFKKNYLLYFLIFLTYAINSTLHYSLYNVFFAQFIYNGINILVILCLLYFEDRDKKDNKSIYLYSFLIGLFLSSLTSIYPESIIFIFAPFVIYVFLNIFNKDRVSYLKLFFFSLLFTIVINPITFLNTYNQIKRVYLSSINTTFIGWEKIRYAAPIEMLGFYNLNYSRNLPWYADAVVGLPILIIWLMGIKSVRKRTIFHAHVMFFLAAAFFYRFIVDNFFVYFRLITYYIFIFSILFSIGVVKFTYKKKLLKTGIIVVILILSVRSFYRTFFQFFWHHRVIDKSLVSLRELNENKKINDPFFTADVYLGEYDLWTRLWREYFLTNKKIISRQNYDYSKKFLDKIDLVLVEKEFAGKRTERLILSDIVWENEYYKLGRICNDDSCLMKIVEDLSQIEIGQNRFEGSLLISGWSISEQTSRWTINKSATIRLVTKFSPSRLIVDVLTLKEPQEIKAYINNIYLGTQTVRSEWSSLEFPIDYYVSPGVQKIRFEFSKGYRPNEVIPGSLDSRNLFVNFREIELN